MQELYFEERHIEMILNGEKLDDRVIHAFSLMKRMFPKQTGLRDTVVIEGAGRWDDKPDGFIQIVFDQSRLHWICVSNKFSEDGVPYSTVLTSSICAKILAVHISLYIYSIYRVCVLFARCSRLFIVQ